MDIQGDDELSDFDDEITENEVTLDWFNEEDDATQEPCEDKMITDSHLDVDANEVNGVFTEQRRSSDTVIGSNHVVETQSISVRKSEQGDKWINNYRLVKELGKGSFAEVYLCQDECTGLRYAMKIISRFAPGPITQASPRSVPCTRFTISEGEISIMKRLKHDNIVRLHEVIDDSKSAKIYVLEEYMENGALVSDPEMSAPFHPLLTRKYIRDVLKGLRYIHRLGVVHRDIKVQNLLRSAADVVKIGDFGCAAMIRGKKDRFVITGTPSYMAPELYRVSEAAGTDVDLFATDIWALGVTLYRLVCGYNPWRAKNEIQLAELISTQEITFPDHLADELQLKDLIIKMLDKSPSSRIALHNIALHPWITANGREPLLFRSSTDLKMHETNASTSHTSSPEKDSSRRSRGLSIDDSVGVINEDDCGMWGRARTDSVRSSLPDDKRDKAQAIILFKSTSKKLMPHDVRPSDHAEKNKNAKRLQSTLLGTLTQSFSFYDARSNRFRSVARSPRNPRRDSVNTEVGEGKPQVAHGVGQTLDGMSRDFGSLENMLGAEDVTVPFQRQQAGLGSRSESASSLASSISRGGNTKVRLSDEDSSFLSLESALDKDNTATTSSISRIAANTSSLPSLHSQPHTHTLSRKKSFVLEPREVVAYSGDAQQLTFNIAYGAVDNDTGSFSPGATLHHPLKQPASSSSVLSLDSSRSSWEGSGASMRRIRRERAIQDSVKAAAKRVRSPPAISSSFHFTNAEVGKLELSPAGEVTPPEAVKVIHEDVKSDRSRIGVGEIGMGCSPPVSPLSVSPSGPLFASEEDEADDGINNCAQVEVLDDDALEKMMSELLLPPRQRGMSEPWNGIISDTSFFSRLQLRSDEGGHTGLHIKYSHAETIGNRPKMEDRCIVNPDFDPLGNFVDVSFACFGIFDGHSSSYVADFLKAHFHGILHDYLFATKPNVQSSIMSFFFSGERVKRDYLKKCRDRSFWLSQALLNTCVALDKAILRLDYDRQRDYLGFDSLSMIELAGSVAAVVVLFADKQQSKTSRRGNNKNNDNNEGRKMYAAICHLGDCRVVLCQAGTAVQLTEDHKPHCPAEKARIEKQGGWVQRDRVNGLLAVSRSFGDIHFKAADPDHWWGDTAAARAAELFPLSPHPSLTHSLRSDLSSGLGDRKLYRSVSWCANQQVVAVPDISILELEAAHEFIIIASDGLWEVFSCQEAVNLVRWHLAEYDGDMDRCCARLVDEAGLRGATDNITVIVVALQQRD